MSIQNVIQIIKSPTQAVRHLLRVPSQSENSSVALDLAIEAVGAARDRKLTHMVLTYLMGETDGVAKDPRHLFRLHMSLQQHREAARTALIIGREEQTSGNYRNAHDLLFSMVQELRHRHIKVPAEMLDNLGLLHSYILAKVMPFPRGLKINVSKITCLTALNEDYEFKTVQLSPSHYVQKMCTFF